MYDHVNEKPRPVAWDEIRAAADEVNIFHPLDAENLNEARTNHEQFQIISRRNIQDR